MVIVRRSRSPIFGRPDDTEGTYYFSVNSGNHFRSESEVANYQESTNSALSLGEGSIVTGAMQNSAEMKCPLCRGSVSGWIPAAEVRQYLDNKLRTCYHDSCKFVGTYVQLREHARTAHLLTKPAHVEVSRKRRWDRLEREQEFGDVISAIRSQIPGAVIVGDYVIETRDVISPDIDSDNDDGEWSPVQQDQFELPYNRLGSPWSTTEMLGSPSIRSDERHNLTQNNRGSLSRSSLGDRRRDWLGVRRPSTHHSLLPRGFSTRHFGHGEGSHHGYRQSYHDHYNAAGTSNDSSRGPPSRRLRRSLYRQMQ